MISCSSICTLSALIAVAMDWQTWEKELSFSGCVPTTEHASQRTNTDHWCKKYIFFWWIMVSVL